MRELNNQQRELLSFMVTNIEQNGRMPTLDEMRTRFGYRSRVTILNQLTVLQQAGFIHRGKGVNALQLRERWATFLYKLPFQGTVG